MSETPSRPKPTRGFARAGALLQGRIRAAGEARGFAVTRLLTHWAEIAGPILSGRTRPVRIGYGRDGFGATLTLLVSGPDAPIVEMEKERIRERVNACYGYNAIARIRLTQIAATGLAEAPAPFAPTAAAPDPAIAERASRVAEGVQNTELRLALAALAANVLARGRT